MLLQIDDNFRVVTDSSLQNYILEHLTDVIDKKTRENVRQDWIVQGYHGASMRSVLIQYRNLALITDDKLKTLHNVLDKLNKVEQTIERVVTKENIKLESKQDD
jgi:hypothetical protein